MILRPSSAHLWINCAGYPRLSATLPPEAPSDPAREGTCAAWVAEMVLTGQAATPTALIGQAHENGWVVDRAMANHIHGYIDVLRSHGGTVYAEQRVVLNALVQGTPDAAAVCDNGTLHVDDLKYGFERSNPNAGISLHARQIEFIHPVKHEAVVITAPVPKEDELWQFFEKAVRE